MDYEELKKVVDQEVSKQYDVLKKAMFFGTEHIAGGGKIQGLGYINRLIEDNFFTFEDVLRDIGRHADNLKRWREMEKDRTSDLKNTLMLAFKIFDKHGLFKDDACFDPEHFIDTVVIPEINGEKN